MKGERLCVFTRYPEPGRTKTRLIPAMGGDAAACLQRAMTAHVLTVASQIGRARGTHVEVRFEGGDPIRMSETFGRAFAYRPQGGGDLGDRMQRCVREGLEAGAHSVVIAGSDVPGIDQDILAAAFDGLRTHDLVIGPAADGGYYLIGLRTDVPELFRNMPWGTEHILRETLAVARHRGLSLCTLPTLADVDRPEDLQALEQAWGKERVAEVICRASVIIPTLDEASRIQDALKALQSLDKEVEIIVVDGGSRDGTAEKAKASGVKVLTAEPGRARQMNAGAEAATGGILLFLHADTRLPEGYGALVRAALNKPGIAAGAFRFRLDGSGGAYRVLERLVNWRARVLDMPYGDQALFMKARVFRELGGFPDLAIMEDFEMIRRLRRRGQLCIVPAAAVTSARRWERRGFLMTTLLNQVMIAGYILGVPPRVLARLYRGRA